MITNSESILVLKEKFNEIKRNINLIEQKQSDFFNSSRRVQPEHSRDCSVRPSSVGREIAQQFRFENSEDLRKENERLRAENEDLRRKNADLVKQNEELKRKAEPVSCIKRDGSLPKKHRVAFSKDLVQVMDLQDNDTPINQFEQQRPSMTLKFNESPVYRKTDENYMQRKPETNTMYNRKDDFSFYRKFNDSFMPHRRDPHEPIRAASPFQFSNHKDIDSSHLYRHRDEILRNSDNYHHNSQPRKTLNSTSPVPLYRNEPRRSYQHDEGYYHRYNFR